LRRLYEKQCRIKGIIIEEPVQDGTEVVACLVTHFRRLIERVFAVAQEVDESLVKDAVGVVLVLLYARGELALALNDSRLFQYGSQYIEMVGVNFVALRRLIKLHQ